MCQTAQCTIREKNDIKANIDNKTTLISSVEQRTSYNVALVRGGCSST